MTTDDRLYLFLDTNIFLHFRCFVEIDWGDVAGRDVALIVPHRPTINELDRHKNENYRAKIRERADTAMQKIKALVAKTARLRGDVPFETWMVNPVARDGLDLNYPDDRLLASALGFAEERKADVAIVTADGGLQLRAPNFGLAVIELPATLRLPHAPDPAEVKLRQLQEQVAAKPAARLGLTFLGGATECSYRLTRGRSKSDAEILDEVRSEYHEDVAAQVRSASDEDWKRREFKHRKNIRDFEVQERISFDVALLLANDGTGPAREIDLAIDFPEQLKVSTVKPERPDADHMTALVRSVQPKAPLGWQVEGQSAVYTIDSVKQSMSKKLPVLYCSLREPEYRGEVSLACRVNAAGDPPINEDVVLSVKLTGI